MTISTARERAQLGSLSRVAACLVKAAEATFSGKTITIRPSNCKDEEGEEVRFQLRRVPLRSGYVYPKDFTREVTYSGGEVIADGVELMRNCVENQERAYRKPTDHLSIDSPIIDREQEIIEGHSIHPWHKCRYPLVGNFTEATMHFVAVDREGLTVVGEI